MTGSLPDQIADRLGVSSTEAETALRRAALEIRAGLAYRGEAEVARLGRFRMVDGAITFEPAERLERLVNHRYAGMPVVEPAAMEPAAGMHASDSDDVDEDDLSRVGPEQHVSETPSPRAPLGARSSDEHIEQAAGDPEQAAEPGAAGKASEKAADDEAIDASAPPDTAMPDEPVDDVEAGAPEGPGETDDDEEDDEEAERAELERLLAGVWTPAMSESDEDHPLGQHDLLEDADFQVVSADDEPAADAPTESVKDDDADTISRGSSTRISDESSPANVPPAPPTVDEREPPRGRAPDDRRPERRRGFGVLIFVAALVLIATAGIVYWLVIEQPATLTAPDPVGEAEPVPPVAPDPDPADPAEEPVADDPPAPAQEETPLRSASPVDPDAGGYTFAISEPSQATARQRAERYGEQGYRVAVLPASVRGRPVYRVVIGQFSSRAEAERHRAELPRDVPQDIWILAL